MEPAVPPEKPGLAPETESDRAWHWVGRAISLLLLLLLLLATVVAWQWARHRAMEQQEQRFQTGAEEIAKAFEGHMDDYRLVLSGARGLLIQGRPTDPAGWARYVEGLTLEATRPGIQGVGFVRRLRPGEGRRVEAERRALGFPGFRVWPAPATAESTIALLHPPTPRNARAMGYDMLSEAVRREAMEQARDGGTFTLSNKLTLLQEDGRDVQAGVLMYLPVFLDGQVPADRETRRERLFGWVYSAFRMGDFGRATLADGWPGYRVALYDGSDLQPEALLFQSQAAPPAPWFEALRSIAPMGHPWVLRIQSLPAFEAQIDQNFPRLVFAAGVLISLLIFGLFEALLRVRRRAYALAHQMTSALRDEQQRVTRILDSTAEGIYGIDLHGRCTFVNRAFISMQRCEPEVLLGTFIHDACHHHRPDGRAFPREDCPILQANQEGRHLRLENEWFIRGDGTGYRANVVVAPILETGRATGSVVTLEDLSHKQAVEQAKHDFISVVSHELRTPLTSIRGTLGLLASGRLREQPEESTRLLDIALRNSERLSHLINDILDFEKLRSGRMSFLLEPLSVRDLLAEAHESNLPFAAARGVILRQLPVPHGLWIRVDRKRMIQALTNLLSNAAKFSPPGSEVLLEGAVQDGRILLRVADHGRGIPVAFQARLFEPFSQAESPGTRSHEGSGLGLSITKALVEDMGGTIDFTSTEGVGTTFTLAFPLEAPPPGA